MFFPSPQVMGILNLTPDSFSDGGEFLPLDAALARARQMVAEGAAILDLGGESSRPGAPAVGVQEELDRVMPVLEKLRRELPVRLSVDTGKAEVMRAAIEAGADIINDVYALRAPGALPVVAGSTVQVCLMHMQGEPRTMQQAPRYHDVVEEVMDFLKQRIQACEQAGIARHRIIVDPGFGFGKTLQHNLRLMRELRHFCELGCPLLVGVSRKSMLGAILGKPPRERLYGGLALAALAVAQGAAIIRTHDVAATLDAVKTAHAVITPDALIA
jgi:dihydropteroate synthase